MTEGTEFTKRCAKCEVVLPASHFSRNATRKDGLQTVCTSCRKEYERNRPKRSFTNEAIAERAAKFAARKAALKPTPAEKQRAWKEANPDKLAATRKKHYAAKYGLTPEELDMTYAQQHGQCAICKVDIEFGNRNKLHVDHDHHTGEVRSLLCGPCNSGLGMFQDDAALMKRAADYVEFYRIVHEASRVE